MLEDLAGSFWFRSLFPLAIGLGYELATRYGRKSDADQFGHEDWFIAIPTMGAALTALPPLIALRASGGQDASEAVSLGALLLVLVTIIAFVVVTLDRRLLGPQRRQGTLVVKLVATWIPNVLALVVSITALAIVAP